MQAAGASSPRRHRSTSRANSSRRSSSPGYRALGVPELASPRNQGGTRQRSTSPGYRALSAPELASETMEGVGVVFKPSPGRHRLTSRADSSRRSSSPEYRALGAPELASPQDQGGAWQRSALPQPNHTVGVPLFPMVPLSPRSPVFTAHPVAGQEHAQGLSPEQERYMGHTRTRTQTHPLRERQTHAHDDTRARTCTCTRTQRTPATHASAGIHAHTLRRTHAMIDLSVPESGGLLRYLEGLRKFQRDFKHSYDQQSSYLLPNAYTVHSELLDIPVPKRRPSMQGSSSPRHNSFEEDTQRARCVTRDLMYALEEQEGLIARLQPHERASLDATLHDHQMKIGADSASGFLFALPFLLSLPVHPCSLVTAGCSVITCSSCFAFGFCFE